MKKLMVIEAIGKLDKLREVLEQVSDEPIDVFATKGRLFDLPKDEYGIELKSKYIREIPVSPYIHEKLKEKIRTSSEVYIATDNDIEGEKIALDIAKMCSGKVPYSRVTFSSLTKSQVMAGIDNPRPIDHFMVEAAQSKRFMDRYLGYSDEEVKLNTGRVVSPLLAAASSEKQKTGVLAKPVQVNNDEFQLLIDLYGATKSEVHAAAAALSSIDLNIDDTELHIVERDYEDNSSLWNGKQALINISAALNMSIKEVEQHLQELYQDGRISYPRSDLNEVSMETAINVERIATHWSIQNCSHEQILEKGKAHSVKYNNLVQEGHEALVPLDMSISPYAKLNDLSPQDRVYSILLRHCLRVSKKQQRIKEMRVSNTTALEAQLKQKLRRQDIQVKLIKRHAYTPGMMISTPMYPEFMPCGVRKYDSIGEVKLRAIPKDQVVAKMLYKNGLGRPSTFAYHVEKISKKFFDHKGAVNEVGDKAIINTKRALPELLKVNSYHELEANFMSKNKSYAQKIDDALRILGVTEAEKPAQKEQSIEFNI